MYMKRFTLKYNKPLLERAMYPKASRKYTTEDITRWVKYGSSIGLFKLDGSTNSEKKIFMWIDYLLRSGNINI